MKGGESEADLISRREDFFVFLFFKVKLGHCYNW